MADLWQYYLLIVIVAIQGLFCLKNNNKIFLFITFLELFFVSGCRNWNIGNDTISYVHTFIASFSQIDLSYSHMEKGYLLFNKILSLFTDNPQAILIVTSFFISVVTMCFIYKYSKFIFFSALLFIILHFSGTLNVVRQYVALMIILLGFTFVIKRNFVWFLLCCLFATTFHYSAILGLVLYFIYPLNIKIKNIIFILIIMVLIFVFIVPVLDRVMVITGRYNSYLGNILMGEETKIATVVKILIEVFIFLFCFISYFFVYNRKDEQVIFIIRPQFLLIASLLALCIHFISIRGTVLERTAIYFSFFNIIAIPSFVNCYPKSIKLILSLFIIGLFVLYKSIVFVYRPEWNHVLPFEFCF